MSAIHSTRNPKAIDPDRQFALGVGVIAVPLGVHIQVGNQHQSHDDQHRRDDPGEPGIEIHQDVLQAKKVPGRFGRDSVFWWGWRLLPAARR